MVNHGDEITFLFKPRLTALNDSIFLKTFEDYEVSKKFVRMLVNFARVSNPTPNPKRKYVYTLTSIRYRLIFEMFFFFKSFPELYLRV